MVDTDILIDVGRGVDQAVKYLERLEAENKLAISSITQMELIVGCQSKTELRTTERFLSRFEIIHLNEYTSNLAVELLREYRLSHGLLIADAFIAATAMHRNLQFVSKNEKDYRFIAEIKLLAYP
jgi:predicted nucleic acid-binding protein